MIKEELMKALYTKAVEGATKECQITGENKAWAFEKHHINAVLVEVDEVMNSLIDTDISRDQDNILYALRDALEQHFYTDGTGEKKN